MRWLPGARMGVSAARAQGPAQGVTTDISSARARLQIDISQNSDTPVPKRGKNGGPTCRPKIRRGTRCAHQFWAQATGCLRARGSKSADLTISAASQAGSPRACTACTKID